MVGVLRPIQEVQIALRRVVHAVAVLVCSQGVGTDMHHQARAISEIPTVHFLSIAQPVAVAIELEGVGAQADFFAVVQPVFVSVCMEEEQIHTLEA